MAYSNRNTFKYKALDRAMNEIRILRLKGASSPTSDIVGELLNETLGDQAYEALSYTWDSGRLTKSITLNEKRFWVTENLHAALRALRLAGEDRYLWVDAVCICQDDVAERSQEVLRMLDIYKTATRVVVWLGTASEDSDLAMDHLWRLNDMWHVANPPEWFARMTLYFYPPMINLWKAMLSQWYSLLCLVMWVTYMMKLHPDSKIVRLTSYIHAIVLVGAIFSSGRKTAGLGQQQYLLDTVTIQALKHLFGRRWFHRTWIVQEIAVSQSALMVCGSKSIPWETFRTAIDQLEYVVNSNSARSPYLDSGFEEVVHLKSSFEFSDLPPSSVRVKKGLLYLINSFSYLDATDPRDKVYGLLGLSNDAKESNDKMQLLTPNYNHSVVQVYTDVVKYLVTTTGRLDVLRSSSAPGNVAGLPTWAPDWTASEQRAVSSLSDYKPAFSVPGNAQNPVAKFSNHMRIMTVRGIVIGRLVGTGRPMFVQSSPSPIKYEYQKVVVDMFLTIVSYTVNLHLLIMNTRLAKFAWDYLARRNPLGLGFIFALLKEISAMEPRRNSDSLPRTLDAFRMSTDTPGRRNLTVKSFDCVPTYRFVPNFKVCSTFVDDARDGDQICLLLGGSNPFLIRQEGKYSRLVGEASLGGVGFEALLERDILEQYAEGHLTVREFRLC